MYFKYQSISIFLFCRLTTVTWLNRFLSNIADEQTSGINTSSGISVGFGADQQLKSQI